MGSALPPASSQSSSLQARSSDTYVKNAPKECQQCTIEACNVQNLLINLRYRLEQGQASDPWFTAVRALNVDNGPS